MEITNNNFNNNEISSTKSTFSFEDLASDDEIYTFQCPASCNKQKICGKNINFHKSKDLVISEKEKYQIEVLNSEKKFITLALPRESGGGRVVKLPITGHIILEKVLDPPVYNLVEKETHDDTEVTFPEDIKIRHPLLGIDWEDHIKMANKAIKSKHHKKKTKEKSMKIEVDSVSVKRGRESSECETPEKKRILY